MAAPGHIARIRARLVALFGPRGNPTPNAVAAPVSSLLFIGPFLSQQMQAANVTSIADLVADVGRFRAPRNATKRIEFLTQNPRRNECLVWRDDVGGGAPVSPGPGSGRYHVRDVNRWGYDSVVELLRFVRNEFGRRRGVAAARRAWHAAGFAAHPRVPRRLSARRRRRSPSG